MKKLTEIERRDALTFENMWKRCLNVTVLAKNERRF